MQETSLGVTQGDTRSLDYSSYRDTSIGSLQIYRGI